MVRLTIPYSTHLVIKPNTSIIICDCVARSIAPEATLTCSYCDLDEVEALSALLLEKLCEASAAKHPTKSSDVNTIALKNAMLTALDIPHCSDNYSFSKRC
jgi:hypothetical protein